VYCMYIIEHCVRYAAMSLSCRSISPLAMQRMCSYVYDGAAAA